jgi:hypothetical protein
VIALTLVSAVALAVALTGTPMAATAAGAGATTSTTFTVPLTNCPGTGQLCPPVRTVGSFTSSRPLVVEFTAGGNHCSGVALRLFVGRRHVKTTPFTDANGTTSAVVPWPRDGRAHRLGYEALGRTGGCNAGALISWDGAIRVTFTPPTCSVGSSSAVAAGTNTTYTGTRNGQRFSGAWDCADKTIEVIWTAAVQCRPLGGSNNAPLVHETFHFQGKTDASGRLKLLSAPGRNDNGLVFDPPQLTTIVASAATMSFGYTAHGAAAGFSCDISGTVRLPKT